MPKASPRASAHRFAVVSNFPRATVYTGTQEQLIALGVAHSEQFPEGRKRLKWDYSMENHIEEGWQVKKLKGGIFEVNKCHEYRPTSETLPLLKKFEIRHKPGIDAKYEWNKYEWALWQGRKFVLDEEAEQEISDVLWSLLETLKHIEDRTRKNPSYLKLVQSVGRSAHG